MISANRQRQQEWDFVKAVLIIFVVWGHVCSYISDPTYERNLLTSVIRLYQMPMFILVSGFFSQPSTSLDSVKITLKKTTIGNIVPYVFWWIIGAITVFVMNAILSEESRGGITYIFKTVAQESNILWFLGCLILCRIYYAISSWLSIKIWHGFFVLAVLLVVFIPKDLWHFSFLYPFFALGAELRRIDLKRFIGRKWTIIWSFAAIILLIVSWNVPTNYTFYNASNFIFARGVSTVVYQLTFIIARYALYGIVTICYLMLFLNIYEIIKAHKSIETICYIGRETLGIFLIHIILLYHIVKPIISTATNNQGLLLNSASIRYYLLGSCVTAIAVVISLKITKMLEMNRITRSILLGRAK